MVAPDVTMPFVGPRPFTEGHHMVFFGRENALPDLGRLLVAERIVLLYSPSGAGKTSLLRAGLIPALIDEKFTVRPVMRVNSDPPEGYSGTRNRFLLSAMMDLHKAFPEDQQQATDPATMGDISFSDYLDQVPRTAPGSSDEVLIFDQFEEILKIGPASRAAHRERIEFFRQVGEALASRQRWAVFSIREDYLAGLDPYRRFIPTYLNTRFRLDVLRVEEARRAIAMPPQQFDVTINDDAVDLLLTNLGRTTETGGNTASLPPEPDDSMYIEPLHLQVVCDRLWRDIQPGAGDTITVEHVGSCGDVDRALGAFYDEGVATVATAIPETDEHAIRDWFEHELIIGAEGIRGQVARGTTHSGSLPNAAADELDEQRLVRRETRLNTYWYELSHDRMIGPVRASNAGWFERELNDIQKRARQWEHDERPDQLLLGVGDWLRARRWARQPDTHLREYERSYLEESGARTWRRLQMTAVVIGALLLAIVGGWGLYTYLREDDAVRQSRELASEARLNLPGDEETSLEWALLYAVAAMEVLDGKPAPPEVQESMLSSLVARPGYIGPIAFTNAPLPTPAAPGSSSVSGEPSDRLAVGSDGRTVAFVDEHAEVTILRGPAQPKVGHAAPKLQGTTFSVGATDVPIVALEIVRVRFIPNLAISNPFNELVSDEDMVLIGRRDGTLEIWRAGSDPQPVATFSRDQTGRLSTTELTRLDVDHAGYLATGYSDGTITLWDISDPATPSAIQTLDRPGRGTNGVSALAFEPRALDAEQEGLPESWQLAAGYSNGSLVSWSGAAGDEPVFSELAALPSGTPVRAIAYAPAAKWLAYGGDDGFSVVQQTITLVPLTATAPITALAFDPGQPNTLLTGHVDGQVWRRTFGTDAITASIDNRAARLGEATGSPVTGMEAIPSGRWVISTSTGIAIPVLWNADGLPSMAFQYNDREAELPTCAIKVGLSVDGTEIRVWTNDSQYLDLPLVRDVTGDAGGTPLPGAFVNQQRPTPLSTLRTEAITCERNGPTRSDQEGDAVPVVDRDGDVWRTDTLAELGEKVNQPGTLVASVVNHDQTMIATGYDTGTIRLWILADKEWVKLVDLPGHTRPIMSLSLSTSGHPYLASLDTSGQVVIWDLEPEHWISYACSQAAYRFDAEAVDLRFGLSQEELEDIERRHPCNPLLGR